jgi:hypothetical protein
MRLAFVLAVVLASFTYMIPIVHAASDCEHTCCRTFSGSWDDDFDNCRSYKDGFDACVSECEAKVWAARPQGPGPASPENTYSCKVGFILAAICIGAIYSGRNR